MGKLTHFRKHWALKSLTFAIFAKELQMPCKIGKVVGLVVALVVMTVDEM